MINYIKADLFRVYHKKSNYVFWSVIVGLFILIVSLTVSQMMGSNYEVADLGRFITETVKFSLLQMGILIFGGQAYYTVYLDDLSASNYPNLFSTGISKLQFVLAKIIVLTTYLVSLFIAGSLAFFAVAGVLTLFLGNIHLPMSEIVLIGKICAMILLGALGYTALANLITFWSQKANLSTVFFFLLIISLINQMAKMISTIPGLDFLEKWLESTLSSSLGEVSVNAITGAPLANLTQSINHVWLTALIYVLIFSSLSVLLLQKVEIKESN